MRGGGVDEQSSPRVSWPPRASAWCRRRGCWGRRSKRRVAAARPRASSAAPEQGRSCHARRARAASAPCRPPSARPRTGASRASSPCATVLRCSTAVAFLEPARQRESLHVITGALVERVLLEKGRAIGVRYRCEGSVCEVRADRDRGEGRGSGGRPLSATIDWRVLVRRTSGFARGLLDPSRSRPRHRGPWSAPPPDVVCAAGTLV